MPAGPRQSPSHRHGRFARATRGRLVHRGVHVALMSRLAAGRTPLLDRWTTSGQTPIRGTAVGSTTPPSELRGVVVKVESRSSWGAQTHPVLELVVRGVEVGTLLAQQRDGVVDSPDMYRECSGTRSSWVSPALLAVPDSVERDSVERDSIERDSVEPGAASASWLASTFKENSLGRRTDRKRSSPLAAAVNVS